jgi:hypothetical protein
MEERLWHENIGALQLKEEMSGHFSAIRSPGKGSTFTLTLVAGLCPASLEENAVDSSAFRFPARVLFA